MNKLVKAQLALEEARKKLNQLLDTPEESRSEQWTADLDGARKAVETRQAEVLAVGALEPEIPEHRQETVEGREIRSLIENASLGAIFSAALGGDAPTGETRELQQHFGMDSNQVPVEMLERRAEANPTPAPGDVGRSQSEIIPYVFPQSVGAFLSVPQPVVPVGQRVYTVLSTAATVGTPAENADQAVAAGAYTAKSLSPGRIQAAFAYSIEDAATLQGMDESLRQNLSDALSDKLDQQVIANLIADGSALDKSSQAPVDFATAVAALYESVDGRYADMESQIRIVLGTTTYGLLAAAYRGTGTNETALMRLKSESGGLRVNSNMPAVASKKQKNLFRLGMRMDAVSPIWSGIRIIRDEFSQSEAGQIVLTAVMLFAVDTLRADPIRVVEFATAS